ncbi:MAG TPA: hypothetical protein O0X32_01350 [Methanocorpusculum sp.]|nr:hypothetical protein [Methanocorpusculum sp.]
MLEKINGEVELLERHLVVMHEVVDHGPVGIMKLTNELHQSQHRIRYSLRVLEQRGYIKATPSGAMATEKAHEMLKNFNHNIDALIERLQLLRE